MVREPRERNGEDQVSNRMFWGVGWALLLGNIACTIWMASRDNPMGVVNALVAVSLVYSMTRYYLTTKEYNRYFKGR